MIGSIEDLLYFWRFLAIDGYNKPLVSHQGYEYESSATTLIAC